MSVKSTITSNLKNLVGKSLNDKYLIIESDDWGSIRMPSNQAYKNLKKKGVKLDSGDSERYNKTDTLAGEEDFEALYSTLSKFKDVNNNSPVFTAISVVANPDFEKIRQNGFLKYEYEPFPVTLNKYNREKALDYWKVGIENKLFVPEFHGREHLNVASWMRALKNEDKSTIHGFEEGCWGFKSPNGKISYQAAFDLEVAEDLNEQIGIIKSGLELFKSIHGYNASFFVPPNGPFNTRLEKISYENGIKYMGASKIQREPQGEGRFKKRFHWLGQKNKLGQVYLTRNCFFEPNDKSKDWIESCLLDIESAFKWNKPAVISSHRTNYIGVLDSDNRKESLFHLETLLKKVLKKWPEVKFITSRELGNIISSANAS